MKIAGVQFDVRLKDVKRNVDRIIAFLKQTSEAGAELTVFPECAVAGYCFDSFDEARPLAEPVPGPTTKCIAAACAEYSLAAIFGMLEADGDRIFNAAVLVGPSGVIGTYRKTHLPFLGIDRFATYGDRPYAVHQVGPLRVGMNICYDAAFPEVSRTLALLGADLIALPTNWPPGSQCAAQCLASARALENNVYFIAVNRVGTERGFTFIGESHVCDPSGQQLHRASKDEEEVFYAEIDLEKARRKHIVRVPDKHEIDRLADRRPDLYGELTQPNDLKSPGRQ